MKKRKPLKSFDFKGFFVCLDVENILLQYKHRIAEGEEAVLLFHRFAVDV